MLPKRNKASSGCWFLGERTRHTIWLIDAPWVNIMLSFRHHSEQMPKRPVSPQDFTGDHSQGCYFVLNRFFIAPLKIADPVIMFRMKAATPTPRTLIRSCKPEKTTTSQKGNHFLAANWHTHTHDWLQPFHQQSRLLIVVHRIERNWTRWRVH